MRGDRFNSCQESPIGQTVPGALSGLRALGGGLGETAAVSAEAPRPNPAWYKPFLWILLIPILTVPLTWFLRDAVLYHSGLCSVTPSFFGAYATCSTGAYLLILSPGLLNLLPLWWLRSSHRKLKVAALWATVLGALRLIVPAAAVIASPDGNQVSGGGLYGPSEFQLAIFAISLLLWALTFPVMWAVARSRVLL